MVNKEKKPLFAQSSLKGKRLMHNYNEMPDQSQQYEDKPFRYTRRPIELDPPLEIIAECHLCGVLIAEDQEVVTYKNETFCSQYHLDEYQEMESECEVA